MNVLFNLFSSKTSNTDPFHGGNEYANTIAITLINKNKEKRNNLYFFCYSREFISTDILNAIKKDKLSQLITKNEALNIEDAIYKYKIKTVFDPLGVGIESKGFSNVKLIYTIHGLRPLEMPTDINEYYLESKLKYVLKRIFKKLYNKKVKNTFKKLLDIPAKEKELIVVSEHTKNTIIAEYNVRPDKIKVLYSPEKQYPVISRENESDFFNIRTEIEPHKYFLIVSSRRWIKNSYRVIKALDELLTNNQSSFKVVLTGSNNKVKSLIKNRKSFYNLGYVETQELEILYKNAFALIYPSLNEGFGYPPLEAMKYGTPVISSMITSLPEILGDAALFFNPFTIKELKARIIQIQNDRNLYDVLKKKALERYHLINMRQKSDLNKIADIISA